MGLAYIVSRGNITATIVWFAITTGATAGLSRYIPWKHTILSSNNVPIAPYVAMNSF